MNRNYENRNHRPVIVLALTAALVCTLALSGPMTVWAAPKLEPNGDIFDAEYYAAHNPDVVAELGTDEALLYQHYEMFGKAEGRRGYDPALDALLTGGQNGQNPGSGTGAGGSGKDTGNGGIGTTPAQGVQTVTISYAGDCTLGSFKGQGGTKFENYYAQYGPTWFFDNVRGIFAADDLTFVNLEGPLTYHPQTVVKKFPIKGLPEYTGILQDGSVEVVNTANNHSLDCGPVGLADTQNALTNAGIGYCGNGARYQAVVNGIRVSFLGYNGFSASNALLNQIAADIARERTDFAANLVIVEFHWGIERMYDSNGTQETLAHWSIDHGADAVIGSHPHCLQGIETYNGKNIYYSFGNFSFGANTNPSDKDTMIVQTTYTFTNGVLTGISPQIIPCRLSSVTNRNDFKPTPVTGAEAERILGKIAGMSQKYPHSFVTGK